MMFYPDFPLLLSNLCALCIDALTMSKGCLGEVNTQKKVLASSVTLKIFFNVRMFSQMMNRIFRT